MLKLFNCQSLVVSFDDIDDNKTVPINWCGFCLPAQSRIKERFMMTDWPTTAFMFPGQGSQIVGMGKDFAETHPVAQNIFRQADEALGFELSKLCFDGPGEELNDTINTQPAIYVCSVAVLSVLQNELPDIVPNCVAGHSLGELTALTAAGSLAFRDGLRLVRERGRLMKKAGEQRPGAMAAILGLQYDEVKTLCEEATSHSGKPVVAANDNCPGQTVISGDSDALDVAMEMASEKGARKTVKLAVSIAAHSPLMQSAATDFRKTLDDTTFAQPKISVYANTNAKSLNNVDDIRQALNRQLTNSVLWTDSIRARLVISR